MTQLRLAVIVACGLGAIASPGQLLINPIGKADPGGAEGGLGLGIFEAEYDADYRGNSTDGDLKREFLFGSLSFGLNDKVDLAAAAAYTLNAEAEDLGDGDTGYILGGGLRAKIWQQDPSSIHLYGQWTYFDEEYGRLPNTSEFIAVHDSATGHELVLGAAYAHTLDHIQFFGGVELIPYSDGDLDIRVSDQGLGGILNESATVDLERADVLSIKLGVLIDLGVVPILLDATLAGEETFRASVAAPL